MLKKNKHKVMDLLTKFPELRDNDNRLLAQVWVGELEDSGNSPSKISGLDFLINITRGNLSSPESIVRVRRKLQEQHPELRGRKWEQRHKAQEAVKDELRTF